MNEPKLKNPDVRQVYEYWLSKASHERLPSRADIRPHELKQLAARAFLIDVLRKPLHFKVRFFGSRLVDWAGRDLTGLVIREADNGVPWRQLFHEYRSVVETRQPRHDEHSAGWGKEYQRYERIVLPLSSDGQTVDMLFGALDLHATPPLGTG
ncbi:MAG: PAS domain-containing protein [Alphaproteobacteria bacterium]|nr:PAS domain-containing protein [Alphaproteobacteria bacterium]MDE2495544.1 PAS domain-containing protein [Alphaproteobacteria bacterium]